MRSILLPLAVSLLAIAPAHSEPKPLKPGEFEWQPELAPAGPVLLVCSVDDQMLYVYRNGTQIARAPSIFGTPSNPASTGVFSIHPQTPQPPREADLPLVRQLSWTGLSIPAAGPAPRPTPFNALHIPQALREKLIPIVRDGATVVVTRKSSAPIRSSAPATVLKQSSSPEESGRAIPKGRPIWEPEKSPDGPVSIFVSYNDSTVYVWRSGVQIGQCPVTMKVPAEQLPDVVFLMLEGPGKPAPDNPAITVHPWTVLSLTGGKASGDIAEYMRKNFTLHPEFRTVVNKILKPGTILFASHHSSTKTNNSGSFGIGSIDDLPDPE